MPFPGNHWRLVVEGSGYGDERWSWGLTMAEPSGSFVSTGNDEVPPSVIAAVRAFHGTSNLASSAARLDLIKFNVIGPDGRYLTSTESVRFDVNPPLAGASAQYPPAQLAVAVTLLTDRARGRGSRGRFYPPYPVVALGVEAETGQMSASAATIFANAATTLINALNAATSTSEPALDDARVVVASDLGAGVFAPVTAVQVGRVVDTMRSRRTSLTEAYVRGPAIDGPT